VDSLISQNIKGIVNGEQSVHRLKTGHVYSRQERIFFVKTVAKYLMNHCHEYVFLHSVLHFVVYAAITSGIMLVRLVTGN